MVIPERQVGGNRKKPLQFNTSLVTSPGQWPETLEVGLSLDPNQATMSDEVCP